MQKERMTEIAGKAFDLSETLEYTMSIRFIPNGFCFIVYARKSDGLLYFMEVAEPGRASVDVLAAYAQKHDVLKASYRQVQFVDENSNYELVPKSIFQEADALKVWQLTHGELDSSAELHTDLLKMIDVNIIYALQNEWVQTVQKTFPTARFLNRQTIFIQSSIMENRRHSEAKLFLNLHSGCVDLVVVDGGKLQMANTFSYRNTDEFLYFVLGVYDLFGLDQYNSLVTVAGLIDADLLAVLQRYLKCVRIVTVPSNIGSEFEKIEAPERYHNLFNIPLCVL